MTHPLQYTDLNALAALVCLEASPELRPPEPADPWVIKALWEDLLKRGLSLSHISRGADGALRGCVLAFMSFDMFSGSPIAVINLWYTRRPRNLGTGLLAMELLERCLDSAERAGARRVLGSAWENGPAIGRLLERRGFRKLETSYHLEIH